VPFARGKLADSHHRCNTHRDTSLPGPLALCACAPQVSERARERASPAEEIECIASLILPLEISPCGREMVTMRGSHQNAGHNHSLLGDEVHRTLPLHLLRCEGVCAAAFRGSLVFANACEILPAAHGQEGTRQAFDIRVSSNRDASWCGHSRREGSAKRCRGSEAPK
jgi:hypothetical protein